jgi:Arc/MetJ-type ribon-helix-helix transcriptional regulator
MQLALNPEIERKIAEQVRLGLFPTPEAVVEAAVVELTERAMDDSVDESDIAAINEAEDQIDRGDGIDLPTLRAEMFKRFKRP